MTPLAAFALGFASGILLACIVGVAMAYRFLTDDTAFDGEAEEARGPRPNTGSPRRF